MKLLLTAIAGCYQLVPNVFRDERGAFVKVFHEEVFREHGLRTDFAEEYYSVSRERVLRGLHFQTPPHEHAKLVYCPQGSVLDVAVDLRVGSPSYGQHIGVELSEANANMLYLPAGLAHGFYTTSTQATMVYKVTSVYAPAHDGGILWSSAGIDWPDADPILSERDRQFPALADFASPFRYAGEGA